MAESKCMFLPINFPSIVEPTLIQPPRSHGLACLLTLSLIDSYPAICPAVLGIGADGKQDRRENRDRLPT
jgi:hypothetical protein